MTGKKGRSSLLSAVHSFPRFQEQSPKDLWPTERALAREGLLFEKGGSHDVDWLAVLKTLEKIKNNQHEDMSTAGMSKRCRALASVLQVISDSNSLKLLLT